MFKRRSDTKVKAGTANGPEIRKIMNNEQFQRALNAKQKHAWIAIKAVIKNVLGKKRAPPEVMRLNVKTMMDAMKKLKSSMTYKMHLLNNHLEDFIQQSATKSDEHGEHIHQLTLPIENRYKGKNMMDAMLAEICWFNQKMMYEAKEEEIEAAVNDESESSDSDESVGLDNSDVSSDDSGELFLSNEPDDGSETNDDDETDDDDDEPAPKKSKPRPSTSKDAMEIQ